MAAWEAAGDPERFPDAGEPWTPLKLYYSHGFLRKRMQLFHDWFIDRGEESPFVEWLKRWDGQRDEIMERITTQVDVGNWFEQRDDALRAHATQIDPNGAFFAVPVDVQRKLWPTEEFELARTRVTTSLPETDLFAGIEETEQ